MSQFVLGSVMKMVANFRQGLNNKIFSVQNLGKNDKNVTLQKRIKFWVNILSNTQCPVPDEVYNYDYIDEALDCSVRGWERRELKKIIEYI